MIPLHTTATKNVSIFALNIISNTSIASFHQNTKTSRPDPACSFKRDYRKQLFVSQECEHLNNRLVSVVFQDNVFILHSSSVELQITLKQSRCVVARKKTNWMCYRCGEIRWNRTTEQYQLFFLNYFLFLIVLSDFFPPSCYISALKMSILHPPHGQCG